MTLSFSVPRKPVSVNQAYVRAKFSSRRGAGGGKGLVLSAVGRSYKESVRAHATIAAQIQGWPTPDLVKCVVVTLVTWNTRHDAAAAEKLTCDAMEGVVYGNDRAIRSVTCAKDSDGRSPRVDVFVKII